MTAVQSNVSQPCALGQKWSEMDVFESLLEGNRIIYIDAVNLPTRNDRLRFLSYLQEIYKFSIKSTKLRVNFTDLMINLQDNDTKHISFRI